MFVGVHERQLDDKGRVALPPAFRHLVGPTCYLVIGLTGCIEIYAPEAFEARARKMLDDVELGKETLNRQRAFAGSASLVTIDKQGRIMVDDRLRQFAGLTPGERVILAGNINRGEIWNEQRRAAVDADGWAQTAGPEHGERGSEDPATTS